jgi:outer membrane protein
MVKNVSRPCSLLFLILLGAPCFAQGQTPADAELAPAPTVVLPALAPEPTPDPSRTLHLSLGEAYRIALAKSPRIGSVLARIRESQARADATGAPLRPQGVLTVLGPPVPPSLAPLRNNLAFAPFQVQIRKILYDGDRIWSRIRQVKEQSKSDEQQAEAEWQQLHLEVTLAYYDALRAQVEVEVAQASLKVTQRQVEENRKRFEAGDLPKGDILQAQVPEADAELVGVRAGSTVKDRQESLALLLGIPLDTPLELSAVDPPKPLDHDLNQCIAQALETRPSIRVSRLGLLAADQAVLAAKHESSPKLTLLAGVIGYQDGPQYISGVGYEAGLELAWPFLDGGLSRDLTRAEKAAREQLVSKLKELERESEIEVRQNYRAVELARQAQQSDQVQLANAQEAYRIASAQYKAGMTSYYVVRQAQVDLLRAEQANSTAVYDYLSARARLDHSRGQTPDVDLPPLSDPLPVQPSAPPVKATP